MDFRLTEEQQAIREAIRKVCGDFPDAYWRAIDKKGEYPQAFVDRLTKDGWLAALVPEEDGGLGLGMTEASIILVEMNRSGGNAQNRRYLPGIAKGELRLQAFAVTEPNAGTDTTRIETAAVRKGDGYIVNGQKIFISRVLQSDLMLLLAPTTPDAELSDKTRGLSTFIVDLRNVKGKLDVKPLDMMINHHTNMVFFENVEVPAENLIGEEGGGFRYILDGMNAERILVAAEAIGDGYWFVDRASKYASERKVFGRPIGANQGVQFPIAQAYAKIKAADLMRYHAAWKFDNKQRCGEEANVAKLLASEAAWEAANACMNTHGGYGFAAEFAV